MTHRHSTFFNIVLFSLAGTLGCAEASDDLDDTQSCVGKCDDFESDEEIDMEGFAEGAGVYVDDDFVSRAELVVEVKRSFAELLPDDQRIDAHLHLDTHTNAEPKEKTVSLVFDGESEFNSNLFDLPDSEWGAVHLELVGEAGDEILYDVVEIGRDECGAVDQGLLCWSTPEPAPSD